MDNLYDLLKHLAENSGGGGVNENLLNKILYPQIDIIKNPELNGQDCSINEEYINNVDNITAEENIGNIANFTIENAKDKLLFSTDSNKAVLLYDTILVIPNNYGLQIPLYLMHDESFKNHHNVYRGGGIIAGISTKGVQSVISLQVTIDTTYTQDILTGTIKIDRADFLHLIVSQTSGGVKSAEVDIWLNDFKLRNPIKL